MNNSHKSLDLAIRNAYPGLFQKQFSESDFASKVSDHHLYKELLIPTSSNPDLFTLNAISTTEINAFFAKKGWGNEKKGALFSFQNSNALDLQKIRGRMLEMAPLADFIFDFKNSDVFSLDLTPVGVAIACANFTRKIGTRLGWPYHMRGS